MNPLLAFDATNRTIDKDGRLHIAKSHITKAGVNPYYGREIPRSQELHLDPNRVYYLLRSPEELAKGAASFARLPIMGVHVHVKSTDTQTDDIVGAIGSDIEWNAPYVDADLSIWDQDAIDHIDDETVRELSASYHYVAIMSPGYYEGERYDGIMTEIVGNHLAVVEKGRAGPDVIAADAQLEPTPMKMTKRGSALLFAVGGVSPKLAADAALLPLLASVTKTNLDRPKLVASLVAMDAEIDTAKLDLAFDAIDGLDDPKTAKDADKDDDKDKPKVAEDEDDDDDEDEDDPDKPGEKRKKKKVAMDAAITAATDKLRTEMREANEARVAVREIVGDVIGMDSAASIYGFALDHLKVDHKGITSPLALKRLVEVSSKVPDAAPLIGMDHAPAAERFPGLNRFRNA